MCGWEQQKEDVQGQHLGENIDERTNKKLKEGSSHIMEHATGEAGDCRERLCRVKDSES